MPLGHSPDPAEFRRAVRDLGVDLTPEVTARLYDYAALLTEWNRRVNLISRRDIHRILTYHLPDSLAPARFLPPGFRCADIGTGAGLPGIPLALARRDLFIILIESIKKKSRFLEHALKHLEVKNALVLNARAETLAPLNCPALLSRLTAPLERTVAESCRHLQPGGLFVFYKSARWPEELKRAQKTLDRYRLRLLKVEVVPLPFTGLERHLVFLTR